MLSLFIILLIIILTILFSKKYINKVKQEQAELYQSIYGEEVNMFCTKCGAKIENGICPNCGTVAQDTNGRPAPNAAPQGNPYAAPYGNPYYGMSGRFNSGGIIPKNAAGWIGALKFLGWIKLIVTVFACIMIGVYFDEMFRTDATFAIIGFFCGIVIGISLVAKDMIYANIAENVGIIGKNVANKDN